VKLVQVSHGLLAIAMLLVFDVCSSDDLPQPESSECSVQSAYCQMT